MKSQCSYFTLLALFNLHLREPTKADPALENCSQKVQLLIEGHQTRMKSSRNTSRLACMDEHKAICRMEEFDKNKMASFKFMRSYMDAVLTLL